jgi:hypothetical protein
MIIAALLVVPERVNVHDGEGCIPFLRDFDLAYHSLVVNQRVSVEQFLPACFPTLAMESPKEEDPSFRIVVSRPWRPRPYHIRMKQFDQRLSVLRIPGARLAVHHLLDFGTNISHVSSLMKSFTLE